MTRRCFLQMVDLSKRFGDRFAAWRESAELVVAPEDLPHLRRLAGDGLREKHEFYRRFEELRREAKGRLGAHA